MSKHVTSLVVNTLILAAISTVAVAQSSVDFEQPIMVDAKSQFVDGKNKTSVFQGEVKIVQGTLEITADEVEAIATEGEGQEVFIARGKPAKYSQTLEDGTAVSASAELIRYEVASKKIQLTGQAELKQATSMVTGNSIIYDMQSQQLMATGDEGGEEGRVTTVFRPDIIKKKETNTDEPDSPY